MDTLPVNPESVSPLVGMTGGLQLLVFQDVCPAETGLERERTVAQQFAYQTTAPALLVWRSKPALLVSRSESRLPLFADSAAELHELGWPVHVRNSGGSACPVGPGTVQLSIIEPAGPIAEINAKYAVVAELIGAALRHLGVDVCRGPIVGAYCPGKSDLAVDGRKIAGTSQHWFRNRRGVRCAATSASINVEQKPEEFERVVNRFYRCAGSPFRCSANALTNLRLSVGTIASNERDLTAAVMNHIGLAAVHSPLLASR